jgi:AcrR family transcriptional regulator
MAAVVALAPKPLRRERRKLEVRTRILEAALALFDLRGFDDTKVSEICDRADVVTKTFFNHFPTKQHLLREIAEQQLKTLFADIELVRRHAGPTREKLLQFFQRIADNIDAAGPMRRALVTEIISAAHGEAGSEQSRRLHAAFAAIVRDGRRAGDVLDRIRSRRRPSSVLGSFYALMLSWSHDAGYPLRRHALAAARVLGDASRAEVGGGKP